MLHAEYKKLEDAEDNVIFGGRLGEYKYYGYGSGDSGCVGDVREN